MNIDEIIHKAEKSDITINHDSNYLMLSLDTLRECLIEAYMEGHKAQYAGGGNKVNHLNIFLNENS